MVRWNGTDYAYLHNLQGDVVGLMDMQGARVVEYLYDAWGKPLGTTGTLAQTLGKANPFRYRGYVWDEETGLYYLRSRYYDPVWGRFLSGDGTCNTMKGLFATNMYTYCGNKPTMRIDGEGKIWKLVLSAVVLAAGKILYANALSTANVSEQKLIKKHPVTAVEVKLCASQADHVTQIVYKDLWNSDQTEANAFRHAYWNALMELRIGSDFAEMFAFAHEEPFIGTEWDENCQMDLHNNAVGRSIGRAFAQAGEAAMWGSNEEREKMLAHYDEQGIEFENYFQMILADQILQAWKSGKLR